jgi:hypothetical protein
MFQHSHNGKMDPAIGSFQIDSNHIQKHHHWWILIFNQNWDGGAPWFNASMLHEFINAVLAQKI